MVVQPLVVVRAHVAAGEALFEMLEEGRVHRHHVFEVAVLGAVLDHQDLAVALDDLRLDLADLLVEQHFVGQLAVENLLANLGHALGTERVSGARPAQGRLLLLVALLQGLVGPLGGEGRVRADAVQPLKNDPRALGRVDDGFLGVLDCFGHKLRSPRRNLVCGGDDHPSDDLSPGTPVICPALRLGCQKSEGSRGTENAVSG